MIASMAQAKSRNAQVRCCTAACSMRFVRFGGSLAVVALLLVTFAATVRASDHLDSPATVANPQADIADIYAWPSRDGKRLNLVMTIQGHSFSDKIDYTLHVDSGRTFGHTRASTSIVCRFAAANAARCRAGAADSASGDPSNPAGLAGHHGRFRVYAALRDDPFYNNVKGLLGAYEAANRVIKDGAPVDAAGCAHFDAVTTHAILDQMSHTDGGPAQNLLRNWTVSAIVVSVDLAVVSAGGTLLAVWGTTSVAGRQIDRMARPFVANTLLGIAPFSSDDASGQRRQEFNVARPVDGGRFVEDLEKGLAFQDALDGNCGNQVLAGAGDSPSRYRALARVFADDRLWVNSAARVCTQFFAVELAHLAGKRPLAEDCGGRTPVYDASNMWRSLLISGATSGITDGLHEDEHPPSTSVFPFLGSARRAWRRSLISTPRASTSVLPHPRTTFPAVREL